MSPRSNQRTRVSGDLTCVHMMLTRRALLDKTTLVPLTNSLYVPGKLADLDNVIVDVGTGYYVKKVRFRYKELYTRAISRILACYMFPTTVPCTSYEALLRQSGLYTIKPGYTAGHDTEETGQSKLPSQRDADETASASDWEGIKIIHCYLLDDLASTLLSSTIIPHVTARRHRDTRCAIPIPNPCLSETYLAMVPDEIISAARALLFRRRPWASFLSDDRHIDCVMQLRVDHGWKVSGLALISCFSSKLYSHESTASTLELDRGCMVADRSPVFNRTSESAIQCSVVT